MITEPAPHAPATANRKGPALDRRTLVRGAAWSVPAVALTTAAPAYANSMDVPAAQRCSEAVLTRHSWDVLSGQLDTSKRNTGWLVRGSYGATGMVSAAEAQWFDGSRSGSGTSNQSDGSFLSFANNGRTDSNAVIRVRHTFQVTGTVTISVQGVAQLGYGNSGTNPQLTDRQLLDVTLSEVGGRENVPVAKLAHRRRNGSRNPYTYYPATATSTTYSNLLRSDNEVAGSGYTLHTATQGEHTYAASYSGQPITLTGSGTRTVYLDHLLTLHRRKNTSWVNDDVIITPPRVIVCR